MRKRNPNRDFQYECFAISLSSRNLVTHTTYFYENPNFCYLLCFQSYRGSISTLRRTGSLGPSANQQTNLTEEGLDLDLDLNNMPSAVDPRTQQMIHLITCNNV